MYWCLLLLVGRRAHYRAACSCLPPFDRIFRYPGLEAGAGHATTMYLHPTQHRLWTSSLQPASNIRLELIK
jgi:hypothetical protein